MAASTGPMLAAGAVVVGNAVILHGDTFVSQTRTIVATAIATAGLSFVERILPGTAVALAWLILAATLLVRVDPKTPAPVESLAAWYTKR